MQKTIKIGDAVFDLAPTGAVLCYYKQQFGVDYYDDFLRISELNADTEATDIQKAALTYEIGYRLIWSMAKAANADIPDPDTWLDSFEDFPITRLLPVAMDLLGETFSQVISEGTGGGGKLTSENLVACCLSCGLNMSDISAMSIGFLLNSIGEFVKIKTGGATETETVRKATQADFDSF